MPADQLPGVPVTMFSRLRHRSRRAVTIREGTPADNALTLALIVEPGPQRETPHGSGPGHGEVTVTGSSQARTTARPSATGPRRPGQGGYLPEMDGDGVRTKPVAAGLEGPRLQRVTWSNGPGC
jgi:hypothetical protein